MKRIISMLLAVVMSITVLPFNIFADDSFLAYTQMPENEGFAEPTVGEVAVSYVPVTFNAFNSSSYVSIEEAAAQLCDQMVNRVATATVKVASTNTNGSEVWNDVWDLVFAHTGNPKEGDSLAWTSCNGKINRDASGSTTYYTLTYNITYYTTAEQEAELDAAVESLLDELDLEGYSDYEKVYVIYRYICDNVTYDHQNLNDPDYGLKYTPYAALINKTAVCNGYALLFYRLALELGIDCRVITGDAGGLHAWNIVKLGDKYYNLDTTWDAEQFSGGNFLYFLKCNENFMNHTSDDEFKTEEFKAQYPISSTDYVYDKEFIIINGTLYQYNGTGGEVVVPNNVTTIASRAFYGCHNVTDIKLPNSLTTIEDRAFMSCSGLKSIAILDSVKSIGDYAFYLCSDLAEVTLSDNLTYLGDYAFNYCSRLLSVIIPEGISSIGDNTFVNSGLKYIHFLSPTVSIPDSSTAIPSSAVICGYVDSTAQDYANKYGRSFADLENGVVYSGMCGDNAAWQIDTNGTLTISGTGKMNNYFGGEPWRDYRSFIFSVIVEEGITEISGYAFYLCQNLKEVTISSSVEGVGTNSFNNCSALTNIFVSDTNEHLTDVNGILFDKSITKLLRYPEGRSDSSYSIPVGVNIIGDNAFQNCYSLNNINLPDSVETINSYAFYFCGGLSRITIPNSVTEIKDYAFYWCNNLTAIVIPENVVTLSNGAFDGCQSLKAISFLSPNTEIYDSANTINSNAVIYGYEGSTAQNYAQRYERTFIKLREGGVIVGDLDNNITVDNNDAIYLLYATIFGEEEYPVNQPCDFDGSGEVDNNDAIYLLYHTIFGEDSYPLIPACTVTFAANAEGVIGMPSEQRVAVGDKAVKPAEPNREGYIFLGWYDNESCEGIPFDFSAPVTEDVILYAGWLIDSGSNYIISNIIFDGINTFTASINALRDVNLNISIQDEYMTTVLYTATTLVQPENEYLTEATCIITDYAVPEYFALTVTLTDSNGNLLCDPFVSLKYTQRYQESLTKTIYDFDSEQVINLDTQSETNFIVAKDDVEVVTLSADTVVSHDEYSGTYTVYGDLSLFNTNLQTDKLIINHNGNIYMIDVQSVSTTNDAIVITENADSDYKDFFTYIKIDDSAVGVQQDAVNAINQPLLMAQNSDIGAGLQPSVEIKFRKDFEKDAIGYSEYYGEIDVTGTAKAFLKVLYDFVLLGEDFIEIEVGYELDATAKANIGIKVEDNPIKSDLSLGKIIFPFATTGVFFMADVTLPFEWEFSGEIEVSATARYKFSCTYTPKNGWTPAKHDPNATASLKAEGKATMFWGLKADIGIYFINQDFLEISIPCKAGIVAEAVITTEGSVSTSGIKHECYLCANGNFYPKLEILVEAKLNINDFLKGKIELPIKIFDFLSSKKLFYISILNAKTSVHGGEVKFGLGDCPNISYKTTISAVGENGYEYDTALNITGSYKMSDNITSSTYIQTEELYLPSSVNLFNGIYTASTTIGDKVYSRRITVDKQKQNVNLLSYYIDGSITEKSFGVGLTDAKVTAYLYDGYEILSFNTKNGKIDSNKSSFTLPLGYDTIYVKVEHADYSTYYTSFSVPNLTGVLSLGNVRMLKYNPSNYYISGTVIDRSNSPLSNVLVELYNANGELVSYTVSNVNGAYSFALPLAQGNYTLNFVKRGYAYNETVPDIIISDSFKDSYSIVTLDKTDVMGDLVLTGFVTDVKGEPLGDVKVLVSDLTGSLSSAIATSNDDGTFAVTLDNIGYYKITYSKSGYLPVVIDSFAVYDDTSSFGTVIMEERPPLAFGTCGENLTWILTEEGELTIYGTGKMDNWNYYSDIPWQSYASLIKNVIISDGVTSIGLYAFRNCFNMKSISIPNSVTFIGLDAFYNCRALTSLIIPSNVTHIGQGAFYNCSGLTNVVIPNGITKIDSHLFTGCTSLVSVDIPDTVTSIGYAAFQNCHALTDVNMPSGVTSIGDYAFNRCLSLTDVEISNGITSIGYYVFSGCESLKHISLPESVTNIRNNAFEDCISLENIKIPNAVTSIGASAFKNCISLTSIVIPEGVTSISDSLFLRCLNLTSVKLPETVTSIGASAFSSCSSLTTIDLPSGITGMGDAVFNLCSNLVTVDLPDGITSIGYRAFANCGNLQSIEIPQSVTTIGESAFTSCDSLISVDIPQNVERVYDQAFWLCDKLERITFHSSTTAIYDNVIGSKTTIYGYEGSTAQSYAKSNYITFVAIS